ncbi:hypothetical protein [Nocardioides stalactiti]|uniref:hypothetical protein n=1 Tax=Nocardioides stalactiti TaxID=2755356 RepID=UPI001603C657|nr:hypothetical protein [Nocardioides stalactiti]
MTAGNALVLLGPAGQAVAPAANRVTIQDNGIDLHGAIITDEDSCAVGRTVLVMKQVGSRGGRDDVRFATDTGEFSVGYWSVRARRAEGRFYAEVKATPRCAGDTSRTIRVTR